MADTKSVEIYCTTQQNISQHVDNIYKDGELTIETTNKKCLLVRQEGNRQVKRNIDHYNLDMIIALGYRVQSQVVSVAGRPNGFTNTFKKGLLWTND